VQQEIQEMGGVSEINEDAATSVPTEDSDNPEAADEGSES
jgi:hypothetical protein